MPIQLDDLKTTTSKVKRSLTPKFFSSKLTGGGRKSGLINENLRPNNVPVTAAMALSNSPIERKHKQSSGDVSTYYIPMAPLTQRSMETRATMAKVPDLEDLYEITTAKIPTYVGLTPQAAVYREDNSPAKGSIREITVQYRIEVWSIQDPDEPFAEVNTHASGRINHPNTVSFMWSYRPMDDVVSFVERCTGLKISGHLVDLWMDDYDVHDRIVRQAEAWVDKDLAEEINAHVRAVAANRTQQSMEILAYQLRYLETYGVSLAAYREIHNTIAKEFSADDASTLSKQNLNLLMTATLEALNKIRGSVPKAPALPANSTFTLPAKFSAQQKAAASTDEVFTMVQAGAGTGKSTVILSRIDYLVASGVPAKDITVLSFTNAAADNISARNPAIGSMTIARMIHDIYNANYTGHELSSIDTIINSLDIFYPQDDLAVLFRRHLVSIAKNDDGSFTAMNTFIERNFDAVMSILNTIHQTSLELEIIICYQKIDTLIEPPEIMSRYLIIDEVQDNSIFEFIFVLKYVAKHKENLYIVGDSSQTLYEFRSSNPKALNALESSGVFATYKLTTNYRSNQEILDFANVTLADIEANQFANIQLQANSLTMPTAASFQEKVKLEYRQYSRITEFPNDLPGIINVSVREFIDDKLAKGEQVAFLAFTRREVAIVEATLKKYWPTSQVANLVPAKLYATTVFSQFIKMYWNSIKQVPVNQAAFTVTQEIINNLPNISRNATKAEPQVRQMISEWWIASANTIDGTIAGVAGSAGTGGWVAMVNKGLMTRDQFFDDLRQSLLDWEIKHNAIKQSVMSQRNKANKEKNMAMDADFVISTIHSAKGLEFDNVVAIHRYESQMDEADKRMYYVAFTRAMKAEYVLSYGTLKNAKIVSDYNLLVEALTERDQANLLRQAAQAGQIDDDGNVVDDEGNILGTQEQLMAGEIMLDEESKEVELSVSEDLLNASDEDDE